MDLNNLQPKLEDKNIRSVLESVRALPDQVEDAWRAANEQLQLPEEYRQVKNVVMTGMGGSGLGARLIEGVYGSELGIPLVRVSDYDLPGFVDENTLVVCSSYSGTTEETLANARQSVERKAKWIAVTTGGPLATFAKEQGVPMYLINPTHNPSGQPRMAIGYSIIGQLALAAKLNLIRVEESDIQHLVQTMRNMQAEFDVDSETGSNAAKQLAEALGNKVVMMIGAEHLAGAGHTVKNQFNESAKHLAARFDIPELNHHLMEGLSYPESNKQNLFFWILTSDLYQLRNQKRMLVTNEVVNKQEITTQIWQARSSSKLEQAFELIQFGSYVVFYLSLMNGANPVEIPWVNYFKTQMGKE